MTLPVSYARLRPRFENESPPPVRHNAVVSFPEWMEPMAATLTQERFSGPEWVFERKFDGVRILAFRQGRDVRLLSRNRLPQNCPPIEEALKSLPAREIILDGELIWGKDGPLITFSTSYGWMVAMYRPCSSMNVMRCCKLFPSKNPSTRLCALPMKSPGSAPVVKGGRESLRSGGTRITSTGDRSSG